MSKTLSDFPNVWRFDERSVAVRRHAARAIAIGRAVLVAYAQVVFGQRPLTGALCLAATLGDVTHGAIGLSGLAATSLWARWFARPDAEIAGGFHGFNGLLVGLGLGLAFDFGPELLVLLAVATLLTAALGAALRNLADRYIGVPVLSLPFVLVTWTALLAARRFADVDISTAAVLTDGASGLLDTYLRCHLMSTKPAACPTRAITLRPSSLTNTSVAR